MTMIGMMVREPNRLLQSEWSVDVIKIGATVVQNSIFVQHSNWISLAYYKVKYNLLYFTICIFLWWPHVSCYFFVYYYFPSFFAEDFIELGLSINLNFCGKTWSIKWVKSSKLKTNVFSGVIYFVLTHFFLFYILCI